MNCRILLTQDTRCERSLAETRTGNSSDARMPIIAHTTSSSTSVKASGFELCPAFPQGAVGRRRWEGDTVQQGVVHCFNERPLWLVCCFAEKIGARREPRPTGSRIRARREPRPTGSKIGARKKPGPTGAL